MTKIGASFVEAAHMRIASLFWPLFAGFRAAPDSDVAADFVAVVTTHPPPALTAC